MEKLIKVILSLLLLFCLLDLSYGYYQFVRFIALIAFLFLAHEAKENDKQTEMIIFLFLAILFQPLLKISLGRELWNIVDVIVGLGLLLSLFVKKSTNEK